MEQNVDNMSGYEATVPVMIANIQRLRAVNAKLRAALEARGCEIDTVDPCFNGMTPKGPYHKPCPTCAAIEAAKS